MIEKDESHQLLAEALARLLREVPIDKLSVTDIVSEAGLSRATFYRCYYDKYKLLNASYDKVLARTLYLFPSKLSWKKAVFSIYSEIKGDLRLYQNAIDSRDINSLRNHIFRISEGLHLSVLERNGIDVSDWKTQKLLESYIYGNLEIMCAWIRDGMREPIDEMQTVMDMEIPSCFAGYFLGGEGVRQPGRTVSCQ